MVGASGKEGSTLKREPNLDDPDGFYAAYIAAHDGLSDAESELLNARLVLILANQIGDRAVLLEALDLARSSFAKAASAPGPDSP